MRLYDPHSEENLSFVQHNLNRKLLNNTKIVFEFEVFDYGTVLSILFLW